MNDQNWQLMAPHQELTAITVGTVFAAVGWYQTDHVLLAALAAGGVAAMGWSIWCNLRAKM